MERRRRRLQDAKSVSVKRRHGAMPAWALSAGEVEIRACCCCLLLLLVAAAAPGRCCRCTRVRTHAAEYPSASPARGNVVSNGQGARGLVYATLGGSLTLGRFKPGDFFSNIAPKCSEPRGGPYSTAWHENSKKRTPATRVCFTPSLITRS